MPTPAILRILTAPLVFAQAQTGGLYDSPVTFSGWTVTAATQQANAIRAPDGKKNALLITEDTSVTTGHYSAVTAVATIPAAPVTYTSYARRGTGQRNYMMQVFSSGFAHSAKVGISLVTGAITTAAAVTGSYTSPSATVTALPQGWFRVTLTFTAVSDTAVVLVCQGISGVLTESYTGDGFSSWAAWGIDFR